ncbi:unnamed protein product, partial [Protopolystoma xenopodis]
MGLDTFSNVSPLMMPTTMPTEDLGDTAVVVTDPLRLTVSAILMLGRPFGVDLIVPGTGIHMNAGLTLFGSGRGGGKPVGRPLVPLGPVYATISRLKCGIRLGAASSGGLWGLLDLVQ